MTIVTPSVWLSELVKKSFLKKYPVRVINNGIDTNTFSPKEDYEIPLVLKHVRKKIILGVASVWDNRKGLNDFIKLSKICDG
jgi:putative colanic acid biosynthesis glycosyltransferase